MLPPLATIDALAQRMGVSVESWDSLETARAEGALADASALVREETGRTWVDTAGVAVGVPDSLVTITLKAAKREMENPSGFTSESDGDYTYRREADQGVGVYLTEHEVTILRRYRLGGSSSLYTVPTTRGPLGGETGWLEDSFGSELVPWYALDSDGGVL